MRERDSPHAPPISFERPHLLEVLCCGDLPDKTSATAIGCDYKCVSRVGGLCLKVGDCAESEFLSSHVFEYSEPVVKGGSLWACYECGFRWRCARRIEVNGEISAFWLFLVRHGRNDTLSSRRRVQEKQNGAAGSEAPLWGQRVKWGFIANNSATRDAPRCPVVLPGKSCLGPELAQPLGNFYSLH